MTSDVVRRRVLVSGRVQGVWYRASAEREAARLGLGGFARNLPDGRVELGIEGPEGAVDALIRWARVGPPRARVDTVVVEEQEPRGERSFYAR